MSVALISLVGVIALALLFDYTNGFHDAANSVSTVVATRVLRPRIAVLWAAGWNFVAFLLVGTAVANTVGQTVKPGSVGLAVVFSALLGAIVWNFLSWRLALPTSSSHALVGGLVGAGVARGGWSAIKVSSVTKTALFIVISPVAGFVVAFLVMGLLRLLLRRVQDVPLTERRFRKVQLLSSAAVSVGHGGNDAQKTMGAIAALLAATGHLSHGPGSKLPIPIWVVLLAYSAIALGTISGGWRIVRTVGMEITRLRPVSGFAAETAAAVALFTSTAVGAPVSTTHTVAGSVTGAGTANRPAPVHWSVLGRLVIAWGVTLPAAAIAAAGAWELTTRPPTVVAGVLVGVLLVALFGSLMVALHHAPSAAEIEADLTSGSDEERPVPLRPGTGSAISAGAPYPPSAEGVAATVPATRAEPAEPARESAIAGIAL